MELEPAAGSRSDPAPSPIDVRRAKVITEGVAHLDDDLASQIIDQILGEVPESTTGQLRARLRKLTMEWDPDGAKARYDRALADRRVYVGSNPAGTANLLELDLPPAPHRRPPMDQPPRPHLHHQTPSPEDAASETKTEPTARRTPLDLPWTRLNHPATPKPNAEHPSAPTLQARADSVVLVSW